MKNRKLSHGEKYLLEAENRFMNSNGYDQAFAANGYADVFAAAGQASNFNPVQGGGYYANGGMGQGAPVAIPDFDRTYTIRIENTTPDTLQAVLFGANQFLLAANFGSPAGINITVDESSYLEMLQESQDYTFISSGFRLQSDSVAQLDQVWTITKRTGNGQDCSYPLQISNYFSAFQFQQTIREVFPYNIEFAGTTQIRFNVLGNTTVVLTLFVGKRIDTRNDLKGRNAIEVSPHKLPFIKKQEVVLEAAPANAPLY